MTYSVALRRTPDTPAPDSTTPDTLATMQRSPRYFEVVTVLIAGMLVAACSSSADSGTTTGGADASTPTTSTAAGTSADGTVAPEVTSTRAPAPVVTDVAGAPDAAPALQPFIDDLIGGRDMVTSCWTVAPARVRQMYADTAAITSAVTGTGTQHQLAIGWTDGTTEVTARYPEIASGYACPYVGADGDPNAMFTAPDAVYAVVRYLGRLAGKPVNPGDVEPAYPLVCEAGPPGPSLRDNPSPFGSVGLADPSGAVAQPAFGDNISVTIPAEIDGLWRDVTATVRIGRNGYCLEELGSSTR